MRIRRPVRFGTRNDVGVLRLILALFLVVGVAHATDETPPGLDRGFNRLYNLDFPGAQKEFQSWEDANPENPMGPVSQAAGILFSEFNRLGVLEAQFYENDSAFATRKKYQPDAEQRARCHSPSSADRPRYGRSASTRYREVSRGSRRSA